MGYIIYMSKEFEYWKSEYYEIYDISGDANDEYVVMNWYREIVLQWPHLDYGTHIFSKEVVGDTVRIKVARFKTKELCRKHCTAPTLGWDPDAKTEI